MGQPRFPRRLRGLLLLLHLRVLQVEPHHLVGQPRLPRRLRGLLHLRILQVEPHYLVDQPWSLSPP